MGRIARVACRLEKSLGMRDLPLLAFPIGLAACGRKDFLSDNGWDAGRRAGDARNLGLPDGLWSFAG